MSNTRDVYLELLADILFVERMLSFQALPDLIEGVSDAALAAALSEHLEQTRAHVARVEAAFRAAHAEVSSNQSQPFVAMLEQHATVAEGAAVPAIADLAHLHAALHSEHYEIASYRLLLVLAEAIAPDALDGLRENLHEEERALERLQSLEADLVHAAGPPAEARR